MPSVALIMHRQLVDDKEYFPTSFDESEHGVVLLQGTWKDF